jgi:F-type H+-transporting ATPase subunit c
VNTFSKVLVLSLAVLLCAAPAIMAQDAKQKADGPSPAEVEKAASDAAAKAQAAVQTAQTILGREGFSIYLGSAFAAGLVILGAAYGIGKIGSTAVDSMARQPEVAGNIQTAMIISAALIEGATFFALIVCLAKT